MNFGNFYDEILRTAELDSDPGLEGSLRNLYGMVDGETLNEQEVRRIAIGFAAGHRKGFSCSCSATRRIAATVETHATSAAETGVISDLSYRETIPGRKR